MMPNAIREISSGGRRRASLSGTRLPSTRNMGGRPALRWMSEAPPRSATCRISLSSMQTTLAAAKGRGKVPDYAGRRRMYDLAPARLTLFALRRVHVPAGVLLGGERQRVDHL